MSISIENIFSETTLKQFAKGLLWGLAKHVNAVQGVFYTTAKNESGVNVVRFVEGYAFHIPETDILEYEFGDGIAGQVAKDGKPIYLENVPEGYLTVLSGLGSSSPKFLLAFPFVLDGKVIAIIEIASFQVIDKIMQEELSLISNKVCNKLIELNKN